MSTDMEKYDEASRELAMRIRTYPRLIVEGKMTKDIASKRQRIMEEIAKDYEARIKSGGLA